MHSACSAIAACALHALSAFDRNGLRPDGTGQDMKRLKLIGAVAIVAGIALEYFRIGAEYSLGTLIAGAGIVAIVYAVMSAREKRRGI